MGVGAMTDFGPLIANPKTALLGGAAQFGVFATMFGVALFNLVPGVDYTMLQACAISIIGGADGPTTIYVAGKLAPEMMAVVAVAAAGVPSDFGYFAVRGDQRPRWRETKKPGCRRAMAFYRPKQPRGHHSGTRHYLPSAKSHPCARAARHDSRRVRSGMVSSRSRRWTNAGTPNEPHRDAQNLA